MIFILMMVGSLLAHPEITISQGMTESKLNQYAGGRNHDKGAFQVIEKYWGKVPDDLRGQVLQNERIMEELLKVTGGDLHAALRKYNGKGRAAKRYADRVIHGALRFSILGQT
jgi:hypothetical protein